GSTTDYPAHDRADPGARTDLGNVAGVGLAADQLPLDLVYRRVDGIGPAVHGDVLHRERQRARLVALVLGLVNGSDLDGDIGARRDHHTAVSVLEIAAHPRRHHVAHLVLPRAYGIVHRRGDGGAGGQS